MPAVTTDRGERKDTGILTGNSVPAINDEQINKSCPVANQLGNGFVGQKHLDECCGDRILQPADFALLAKATPIPLAHGERELTRFTTRDFMNNGSLRYVMFDGTRYAGFTECLRVAHMADHAAHQPLADREVFFQLFDFQHDRAVAAFGDAGTKKGERR